MMTPRRFALLTALVVLAFLYLKVRSERAVVRISVRGDGDFENWIVEGLERSGIRVKLVDEGGIQFDQFAMTFAFKGEIYHIGWSPDVIGEIRSEFPSIDLKFAPVLDGRIGSSVIIEEVAELLRSGISDGFQNGYLVLPIAVFDGSGNELGIYDPLSGEFRFKEVEP